jgi:hypothetical protein
MKNKALSYVKLMATALICTSLVSFPANAKNLYSVWKLEPQSPLGLVETKFGQRFFTHRIVPYKLVKLKKPAILSPKKTLPAGTTLFSVYQSDGVMAYCTAKDQSAKNVAKSLFIPALDKRPCLIDKNNDGSFDAVFSVFDKFGSALTPSGNISSAKPLNSSAEFEVAPSTEFSVNRYFHYSLGKKKDGAEFAVSFENGGSETPMENYAKESMPLAPKSGNLSFAIKNIEGNNLKGELSADSTIYVIGDSSGLFTFGPLLDFMK